MNEKRRPRPPGAGDAGGCLLDDVSLSSLLVRVLLSADFAVDCRAATTEAPACEVRRAAGPARHDARLPRHDARAPSPGGALSK